MPTEHVHEQVKQIAAMPLAAVNWAQWLQLAVSLFQAIIPVIQQHLPTPPTPTPVTPPK